MTVNSELISPTLSVVSACEVSSSSSLLAFKANVVALGDTVSDSLGFVCFFSSRSNSSAVLDYVAHLPVFWTVMEGYSVL